MSASFFFVPLQPEQTIQFSEVNEVKEFKEVKDDSFIIAAVSGFHCVRTGGNLL